jgi:peptidyl-prolyl cis-trans isomerase SurA
MMPVSRTIGCSFREFVRGMAVAAVLSLGLSGLPAFVAEASSIAVLVNDEPITEYDVAQRTRLLQATSGGSATRAQAIEELIEERLKLQSARRLSISVSTSEIDSAFARIASSVNLSPSQFVQALGQIGVHQDTLKNRLRADLAWRDVVRSQLRQEVDIREQDVQAALSQRGEEATTTSVELTLRQIMFVVPANASQEYVRRRQQEANQFRSQFSGCENARELARNFRDTVVQPETRRSSADLSPQMRELLVALGEGEVSQPNVTDEAVELIAVCSRREVQDMATARAEIQDSMVGEQGERLARRLMIDLKQAAIIEYR